MHCALCLSETESSEESTQAPGSNLPHLITLYLHFLPKKLNTGPDRPGKRASSGLFVSLRLSSWLKLGKPFQARAGYMALLHPVFPYITHGR